MRDMRLTRRRLAAVLAWLALQNGALAQIARTFPRGTAQARITFDAPPQVLVDGVRERLGPGVQVRDENNRAPPWNALRGRTVTANYQRDASGAIFRIWLLTPGELQQAAQRRPARPRSGAWYVD